MILASSLCQQDVETHVLFKTAAEINKEVYQMSWNLYLQPWNWPACCQYRLNGWVGYLQPRCWDFQNPLHHYLHRLQARITPLQGQTEYFVSQILENSVTGVGAGRRSLPVALTAADFIFGRICLTTLLLSPSCSSGGNIKDVWFFFSILAIKAIWPTDQCYLQWLFFF